MLKYFTLFLLCTSTCLGQVSESPVSIVTRARTKLADSASAKNRNLIEKSQERTSLMDIINADPNGVSDSRSALLAASNANHVIDIPSGTYRIATDLTVTAPLNFLPGAMISLDSGADLTCTQTLTADPRQQIFVCPAASRIILNQPHSVCWYGAIPTGTGNSSTAIQQAIWCAVNGDVDGYQQNQGGNVYFPTGYYRCDDTITYRGGSGLGLTIYGEKDTGNWAGANNGSTLHWYGTETQFLVLSGANNTVLRDLKINSEAGTNVEKILSLDAKNGDVPNEPRDNPSTGIELYNIKISIGGMGEVDCSDACELISIGHIPVGDSTTSQCDTITFNGVYLLGRGGNAAQDGGGIGIYWHGGGNTKVANLNKIVTLGLHTGLRGTFSGHIVIRDWGGGANGYYDLVQEGSGTIVITGMNSEGSHGLLKQSGGSGACTCIIQGAEWYGWPGAFAPGGIPSVITIQGYVELAGCTLSLNNVATPEVNSTPWIALVGDAREINETSDYAPLSYHTTLTINGLSINKAYSDGGFLYPPIHFNGNPLYETNGWANPQRFRVSVQGLTSSEAWEGVEHGVKSIIPKPIGPAHLTEYLKDNLSFSRINHNNLVTTMGGTTLNDGLGHTYHYDVTSTATDDNNFVETGPNGVGRFLRVLSASEKIGNGTVATPVLSLAGASTDFYYSRWVPTSVPTDNHRMIQMEVPSNTYAYSTFAQSISSNIFISEHFNTHATGAAQQYIHTTAGDAAYRLGSGTAGHDWTIGMDQSDSGKLKIGSHDSVGTDTAITINKDTFATTHSGPINFSGTNHSGLKLNALTTAQRDGLSPENGDTIYNSTSNKVQARVNGTWLSLNPLKSRLTSDVISSTTTLTPLTTMSVNLNTGVSYSGKLILFCDNTVAADGIKIDYDGGSSTMTSFRAQTSIVDSTGTVQGIGQTTAVSTNIDASTITGSSLVETTFGFVCNTTGTFIPRFSLSAETTGIATVYLNSSLILEEIE